MERGKTNNLSVAHERQDNCEQDNVHMRDTNCEWVDHRREYSPSLAVPSSWHEACWEQRVVGYHEKKLDGRYHEQGAIAVARDPHFVIEIGNSRSQCINTQLRL